MFPFVERLHTQSLYRERSVCKGGLNFSSNDYLALASDPIVQQVFQRAFHAAPVGSGGSTVLNGYHVEHAQCERAFADALGVEAAMLFNSGYVANLSLMALLAKANILVVMDKALHASYYDGLRLSRGQYSRFASKNYQQMHEQTQALTGDWMHVTESVFSMGGHLTPLRALLHPQSQGMIVDEAHAFGLFGPQGLGRVMALGLTDKEVPLRVIPLGKALGAQGAIVAGRADWMAALLQVARGAIYSTAMSPAFAKGLTATLGIIRAADDRRLRLFQNIAYFRTLVAASSQSWEDSETAIQHLNLGDAARAVTVSKQLAAAEIICCAIRPPTVSRGASGLRVVLRADHTFSQLDHFMETVERVVQDDNISHSKSW